MSEVEGSGPSQRGLTAPRQAAARPGSTCQPSSGDEVQQTGERPSRAVTLTLAR